LLKQRIQRLVQVRKPGGNGGEGNDEFAHGAVQM